MPYGHLPTLAIQRKANGRLVPSVSGGKSSANQIEAVAECLLDNLGRAVSYKQIIGVIGRKSDDSSSRHLLRQYVSVLREMLVADNGVASPAVPFAVPILLRLASHSRCCRVLDLEPMIDPA
jgi:hypothetical protein